MLIQKKQSLNIKTGPSFGASVRFIGEIPDIYYQKDWYKRLLNAGNNQDEIFITLAKAEESGLKNLRAIYYLYAKRELGTRRFFALDDLGKGVDDLMSRVSKSVENILNPKDI